MLEQSVILDCGSCVLTLQRPPLVFFIFGGVQFCDPSTIFVAGTDTDTKMLQIGLQ